MSVEIVLTPLSLTAILEGEIDHHRAAAIRRELDDALRLHTPSVLRLDFEDVSFMDSSGIGLVMGRYRLMQELGGRIQVINLTPRQYKVMQLAGLEKLATLALRDKKELKV